MDNLNSKEQLVLKLITENPFISQQELAEIVQLSRSAVANIISGLVKKKYVLGKAYVLNDIHPVICIGGANIDRKFYAKDDLIPGTSNPVTSSITVGGVARNIAENLGRLGEEVILFSASGNDSGWQEIYNLSSPFMNLDFVTQFDGLSTGSYTAVLNKNGDLYTAFADMDIYEKITPSLLMKNSTTLQKAKCIVVDLNVPKETVEFLSSFTNKHGIPLVIVPVSSPKMDRLPKALHEVTWLILNKDETETYFNRTLNNQEEIIEAAREWLELGVKNVIITNGAKGVVAGDDSGKIRYFKAVETPTVVDVTGAGDAFCSAVIHSWLNKKELDYVVTSGLVNGHKTILSNYTVRQDLSEAKLKHDVEEFLHE
ncbi:carbohydrate kinase [Bacillaceae bacterium S4-13-58]